MLWSILICTLESRKELFDKLHSHLLKQINDNNFKDVEILYFSDNKDYPVGIKRNTLIDQANGDYVSFIDDDDEVSDNYVKLIHDAIQDREVDCVGIKGLLVSEILGTKEFIHSLKYTSYFEDWNYYYRPPNHLNPIKKEKIQDIRFPYTNCGEDTNWAMQVCGSGVLKEETFINEILYYYNFEYATSETQTRRGAKKNVK